MSGRVFFTICIAFMSGIFFRSFFYLDRYMLVLLGVTGCALLCAARIVQTKPGSSMGLLGLGLLCAALGGGHMDGAMRATTVFQVYESKEVMFDARIVREPEERGVRTHLYVRPLGIPESRERVLVMAGRFEYENADVGYGDLLTVTGMLERPEAFATDGGRSFDYPGYLRARAVRHVVYDAQITKVRDGERGFMGVLFDAKHSFQRAVEETIPQPMAGLGEGVLLGVNGTLSETLEDAFRTTGIIHIVVLSGYNIMIIVEWLTYVLSFMFGPRLRTYLGVAAVGAFVLLVGASATAVRAGIMASLLLVARGTGRTYTVLRALTLAALCMLIVNPFLLVHDPGFQLSFLATLGLIVLAPRLERYCTRIPERFGLRTVVIATVATQIFVLPLLLYQTGLFSVVSVAVNVLVLPAVPWAMLFTLCTGAAGMAFPAIAPLFGLVATFLLSYTITIAEAFATLPFAAFTLGVFPFWITCALYAVLVAFLVRSVSYTDTSGDQHDLASWTIEVDTENPADARNASAGFSSVSR